MKILDHRTSLGHPEKFTGNVYPTSIIIGEEPSRVRISMVHFAPGARSAWHSHAIGQYLHIAEGTALLQERGKEVQVLKTGTTIYTAPGVEHWHGAAPDCFMSHLAIWEAPAPGSDSADIDWGEKVSDSEYKVTV
jgi:quercetin dioxygenase-like cupin family protein